MEKMKNNLDYHIIKNGIPIHKINWNKYNSKNQNWKNLTDLFKEKDFIDLLFIKLTGITPKKKEKKLLLKTLLLSSVGTGHHPPSVMIPKLISSTTKNKEFAIINGLIGGISSFGTDHLGTISDVMKTLEKLKIRTNNYSLEYKIKDYIEKKYKTTRG